MNKEYAKLSKKISNIKNVTEKENKKLENLVSENNAFISGNRENNNKLKESLISDNIKETEKCEELITKNKIQKNRNEIIIKHIKENIAKYDSEKIELEKELNVVYCNLVVRYWELKKLAFNKISEQYENELMKINSILTFIYNIGRNPNYQNISNLVSISQITQSKSKPFAFDRKPFDTTLGKVDIDKDKIEKEILDTEIQ